MKKIMKKRLIAASIFSILIIIMIISLISYIFINDSYKLNIPENIKEKTIISESNVKLYNIYPSKKEDVYRVVITGDSVIEGVCPDVAELEDRLNYDIEKLVIGNREINHINIMNAGKTGSTITEISEHIDVAVKKGLNMDMLYVLSGWNDHWYNLQNNPCVRANCYDDIELGRLLLNKTKNKKGLEKYIAKVGFGYWINKNSEKCQNMFNENPESFLEGMDPFNTSLYRVDLDTYEQTLVDIISSSRKRGTETIIITPPDALGDQLPQMFIEHCTMLDKHQEVHDLYVNKAVETAKMQSAPIFDMRGEFAKIPDSSNLLFNDPSIDPIHPSLKNGRFICTEMFYYDILARILELENVTEIELRQLNGNPGFD